MAIDLLALKPHKVSRDLTGYITYIYGEPKSGKTTLAMQMGNALLLAFERGYNALPGVIAQDITSWSDLKAVVRELKKEEVQKTFRAVVVDTVDIAGLLCEKFICNQNGVDKITAIPYGQGWSAMRREFESTFRTITQLGYALFFISHCKDKTFKNQNGEEYNQIIPTCSTTCNEIVKGMADIYAFAQKYVEKDSGIAKVKLVLRSQDNSADTGCRFKYIASEIPMSYQDLVNALNEAIDKEAEATGGEFVTTERNIGPTADTPELLDYDSLIQQFNDIAANVMAKDPSQQSRIVFVVEKYLGVGKKVSESSYAQVELIKLIVDELKDIYKM